MRLIEVRDGFIKFESDNELFLSDFLHLKDSKKEYIAQVVQVKRGGDVFVIYAKILFNYCGAMHPYDRTPPEADAIITKFTNEIVNEILTPKNPIELGKVYSDETRIALSSEALNKNTLFSIDDQTTINNIITNIKEQVNSDSKVFVIDMLGVSNTLKAIAGVDFKLPLNSESLGFLFEDCLNDTTADSKALIKEIFQDLAEYANTVDFLPFSALKSIIDDMVDKSHIFKLLVLKNKLAKFDKLGYFAATKEDANNLNKLLQTKDVNFDLSGLDPIFQNRYLRVIYTTIAQLYPESKVIVITSNAVDKKNLKLILTNENLYTVFFTHSRFKYLKEIKNLFENYVIEPTFSNNEIFKTYSIFLKSIQKDKVLLVGDASKSLPIVIDCGLMDFSKKQITQDNNIESSVVEEILNDDEEKTAIAEISDDYSDNDIETSQINSIDAIEQKSETFIEKISEDVENIVDSISENLFEDESISSEELSPEDLDSNDNIDEDEETSCITESDINIGLPIEEKETIEDTELDSSEEQSPNISSTNFSERFHTEVDEITSIEMPEEISNLAEENFDLENINLENSESKDFSSETEEEEKDEENNELLNSNNVAEELLTEFDKEDSEFNNDEIIESDEPIKEYSQSIKDSFEDRSAQNPEDIQIRDYSEQDDLNNEELNDNFDVIVELDENDDNLDDAILIDIDDNNSNEQYLGDDLDKSIVEDVDKVFTTIKEDSISDSDLDFIDELNSDENFMEDTEVSYTEGLEALEGFDEIEEADTEILEPLEELSDFSSNDDEKILETKSATTPIVPVYDAEIPPEDLIQSDEIEQGDAVSHAKYGKGIVEKMIKYGAKTLYSINFDNVGRRLLDPTLTEIKKI